MRACVNASKTRQLRITPMNDDEIIYSAFDTIANGPYLYVYQMKAVMDQIERSLGRRIFTPEDLAEARSINSNAHMKREELLKFLLQITQSDSLLGLLARPSRHLTSPPHPEVTPKKEEPMDQVRTGPKEKDLTSTVYYLEGKLREKNATIKQLQSFKLSDESLRLKILQQEGIITKQQADIERLERKVALLERDSTFKKTSPKREKFPHLEKYAEAKRFTSKPEAKATSSYRHNRTLTLKALGVLLLAWVIFNTFRWIVTVGVSYEPDQYGLWSLHTLFYLLPWLQKIATWWKPNDLLYN